MCKTCCKIFCPRRSIDITYCDQKITYVQAGILEQPERIKYGKRNNQCNKNR